MRWKLIVIDIQHTQLLIRALNISSLRGMEIIYSTEVTKCNYELGTW